MEFDPEEKQSREKSKEVLRGSRRDKKDDCNVDISHEDLSDVSDLESMDPTSEDDHPSARKSFNSVRLQDICFCTIVYLCGHHCLIIMLFFT